ncbi:hypothetical protein PV327_010579 [Microctonus hyperodae]|uniref:Uncharacterized protein n=1 Tax=Microctonus hyperodae TaxID=165561 RepID=A0AA39FSH9_MICHY|nr:hypothetical protein PV327_010579 [Microctonus hyperodae]
MENNNNSSNVREKMMELIKSCYDDQYTTTIVITPDISETFYQFSWNSKTFTPATMLDNNFKPNESKDYSSQIATFILTANSIKSFNKTLIALKSSPWWNIHGLLFIVGNLPDGCKSAAVILKQAWKINLYSSLFLCNDENDNFRLFMFNPYTNRAVYPWKEVKYLDKPNKSWTLYQQHYNEAQENCSSLHFDKTQFLNGFAIQAVASVKYGDSWNDNEDYGADSMVQKLAFPEDAHFLRDLLASMNASLNITYDNPGFFKNGKAMGYLKKIVDGTHDLSVSVQKPFHNLSGTYPIVVLPVRLLTQKRNFLRPEEKVAAYYSTELLYLTGIILLLTYLFLVLSYEKEKYSSALFDILRLIFSSSLLLPFNKLSKRIFFVWIFQLIIILNTSFQGNLSAFLTRPFRYSIDTLQDLVTFNYDIYTPVAYGQLIDTVEVDALPIQFIPESDCGSYILNNSRAACLEAPSRMLSWTTQTECHISKTNVVELYITLWCRDDWPLLKKFDSDALFMIEAGIYHYYRYKFLMVPLEILNYKEMDETSARHRPISIDDLSFVFRLLAVGLALSIFAFMVEIIRWKNIWIRFKNLLCGIKVWITFRVKKLWKKND